MSETVEQSGLEVSLETVEPISLDSDDDMLQLDITQNIENHEKFVRSLSIQIEEVNGMYYTYHNVLKCIIHIFN